MKYLGAPPTKAGRTPGYFLATKPDGSVSRRAAYFLELVRGEQDGETTLLDTVELPFVNSMRRMAPHALIRTWTGGGVYREGNDFAQQGFTVTGRSGFDQLSLVRFHKFLNFMAEYGAAVKLNHGAITRGVETKLLLNFPFEGESWECDIVTWEYRRAHGSSTTSYEYTLTLVTNAPVGRQWSPINAFVQYLNGDPTRRGEDSNHAIPGHPCFVASLDALERGPIPAWPAFTPVRDIQEAAKTYRETTRVLRAETAPIPTIIAVEATITAAISKLYLGYSLLTPELAYEARSAFYTTMGWALSLQMQMRRILGSLFVRVGEPGIGLTSYGSAVPHRGTPTIRHVVTTERTAADVAGQALGDRSRWRDIARLNSMMDARTLQDGRPLGGGALLSVPALDAPSAAPSLYGTNLLLESGDLVVKDNDFVVVSGVPNLLQNVGQRMRTVRGDNTVFPRFGLAPLAERTTSVLAGSMMSDVQRQVLRDHRVRQVRDLVVSQRGVIFDTSYSIETLQGEVAEVAAEQTAELT